MIASANREVQPLGNAPELKGVKDVAGGFRWNPGDNAVDYWWPQGITGSADATPGGVVDGHRELLVSWYSKNGKGTRVSFVNADSLEQHEVPPRAARRARTTAAASASSRATRAGSPGSATTSTSPRPTAGCACSTCATC